MSDELADEWTAQCDACGYQLALRAPHAFGREAAVEALAEKGWRCTRDSEMCPTCVEHGKIAALAAAKEQGLK